MNCFHFLWELIILEIWLIVCLELQFLVLFFLLSPYYLPLLTCLESHEDLYHIYLVFFITFSCCISQFFILKPQIIITFFLKFIIRITSGLRFFLLASDNSQYSSDILLADHQIMLKFIICNFFPFSAFSNYVFSLVNLK